MPVPRKPITEEKIQLHPRNKHRHRYNFPELTAANPDLKKYVALNPYNELSIDFKNPEAVIALNKALLKASYGVNEWEIPQGYLCPPIPGRADYIHYVADLLAEGNNGIIPLGKTVKVLDIGIGANCIYPLIGHSEYGWSFVGSEIDDLAIRSARHIIEANKLSEVITIRRQKSRSQLFTGIINPSEVFDLTVCNPPFHASQKETMAGNERKWKNLDKTPETALNFGGKNVELWCEGGEMRFVRQLIEESAQFPQSAKWFTSLVSKKENLDGCYKALQWVKATDVKTIKMAQGQKASRILAWTFKS